MHNGQVSEKLLLLKVTQNVEHRESMQEVNKKMKGQNI